jgi:hypothetical protein
MVLEIVSWVTEGLSAPGVRVASGSSPASAAPVVAASSAATTKRMTLATQLLGITLEEIAGDTPSAAEPIERARSKTDFGHLVLLHCLEADAKKPSKGWL